MQLVRRRWHRCSEALCHKKTIQTTEQMKKAQCYTALNKRTTRSTPGSSAHIHPSDNSTARGSAQGSVSSNEPAASCPAQLNSQSTGREIFAKWNILDRKVLDTKSLQQAQQTVHLHRVAAGLISEREAIELHVDECSMGQAWSLLMASCSVCTRCSRDSGKPDAKRPQVF